MSTRPRHAPLRAAILGFAALACSPDLAPEDPAIVRLAERVDRTTVVDSPLLDLPPLEELGPIVEAPLLSEDFETRDETAFGWKAGAGAISTVDGRRAWCHGAIPPNRIPIVLPARPATRYRVRRRIESSDARLDLQVLERSVRLEHPETLNHPDDLVPVFDARFNRGRGLLVIHHFPEPEAGDWRDDAIEILTSGQTRSLALVFTRVAETTAGVPIEGCVDRVEVAELRPDARQRLALSREWARRPDAPFGLVKRGQLLSTPPIHAAEPPLDRNLDHRDAIFAPAPTRLRFPLRPPEGARLAFSYGLARTTAPGSEVAFAVRLLSADGATTLFEDSVATAEDGTTGPWRDGEADLSPWAGRDVAVELATASPAGADAHGLWGGPVVDRPRRPDDPPNVVLFGIDTLRVDALSLYGYERPTSPNLERLAADGALFTQAVTSAPWTAPSFATIFTGLMPSRHGVVHRLAAMSPEAVTITDRLREAGWRAHAYAFKPYLYNLGFDQGFDVWHNVPRMELVAGDVAERASAFLDRHGDRPFFLFLHIDDAHQPMRPPPPYDTLYASAEDLERFGVELPDNLATHAYRECAACRSGNGRVVPEYRRLVRDVYDGAVTYLDDRIGAVLDELRRRGLYDDAVIVAVSDHGETIWDRPGDFGHGGSLSEELVRGLLVIKPHEGARLPSGVVVDAQVRTADLPPTLLELVGLDPGPPTGESSSLLPMIEDPDAARPRPAIAEDPRSHKVAVRHGGWKYEVRFFARRPPRERLYDLDRDPTEVANLAAERGDVADRLRPLAVRHLLRNRGGRYVLAVGDGEPGGWRLELSGGDAADVQVIVGRPAPRSGPPDPAELVLEGEASSALLAFAEMGAGGAESLRQARLWWRGEEADRRGAADWIEADHDMVDRVLAGSGPAIYLLDVPTAPVDARVKTSESAENLEQLRALGYLD